MIIRNFARVIAGIAAATSVLGATAPAHAAAPTGRSAAWVANGLTFGNIRFHTNDDDKDWDTRVTIGVYERNGTEAAYLDGDLAGFPDQSDSSVYYLTLLDGNATPDTLRGGTVKIHIQPNGHDTWKFDFHLTLGFGDGSGLGADNYGIQLSQSHRDGSWGIG